MKVFSERIEFAKEITKRAGLKIKELRTGDVVTISKGRNDLLTIADGISEKMIVEAIIKTFPDDSIIGEENGETKRGTSEYTWVIDPLDGTINYSHNLPFYGVSVGIMKDKLPYGGAIYLPMFDELYCCERGKGAFCNDIKLSVSKCAELKDAYCTYGYSNRDVTKREYADKTYENLMHNSMNSLSFLCATFSFANVAKGNFDCYVSIGMYLWDLCVGAVLVEEAGGKWSTPDGKDLDYSSYKCEYVGFATNSNIHDEVVSIMQDIKLS